MNFHGLVPGVFWSFVYIFSTQSENSANCITGIFRCELIVLELINVLRVSILFRASLLSPTFPIFLKIDMFWRVLAQGLQILSRNDYHTAAIPINFRVWVCIVGYSSSLNIRLELVSEKNTNKFSLGRGQNITVSGWFKHQKNRSNFARGQESAIGAT